MATEPRRRPARPLGFAVLAIVLAIVLFGAVNLVATLKWGSARVDLTEQSLFTLKDSTRQVLSGLQEPITIKLYRTAQFVDAVAEVHTHEAQVSELLDTFRQVSNGKIRLETVETTPFSAEEDEALAQGLHGFQLNSQGERGYFGIVATNSVDNVETIEFLDPARQAFLQYDLTRLVYRLAHPDETQVGIIDGLSMYGSFADQRRPWAILDLIGQSYALKDIAADATEIPPTTNVLLITHPSHMSAGLQFAVDQYVLGGGKALIFIDPLAEESVRSTQNPQVPQSPSSDLAPLMAAWGARMDPAVVVGDRDMAMQTVGIAGDQRVVANYLPWLRIDGPQLDKQDPITARLEVMRMSSAGAITPIAGATTTITPLIETTTNSMLLDQQAVMNRPNPNVFLDKFVPSGTRQVLAARITGPAKTAFPNGRPAGADDAPQAAPGAPLPPAAPVLKTGNINVIVVADTDMLADSHMIDAQRQPTTSNGDFVLNAIDDLVGGDALIGLRGGGLASRPFTTVQAIQTRADDAYRATEQRLSGELTDVQQRLQALQAPSAATGSDPAAAARAQQKTVAEYDARIVDLRRQLREVRLALRSEIDALDLHLRLLNIGLAPLLVILGAILVALWRRLRLARYLRRLRTATRPEARS